MDKKFLKEQGLLDAQRKFTKLYEYTFIGADDLTNEDEDEEGQADNASQTDDSSNQYDGDMGTGQNAVDQNADASIPDNADDGVEGLELDTDAIDDETADDVETEQDGDEVIDVDDLTNAQEDTENNVEKLNIKFDKLLSMVDNFNDMISSNDAKIDDLRAEIEKRNPTQIEKLSMQTQNSYPFNVTPQQYWNEKEQTSNYRTDSDNNGEDEGQYVITKNDVDGNTDWRSISKSLDDEELHQDLNTIFNY